MTNVLYNVPHIHYQSAKYTKCLIIVMTCLLSFSAILSLLLVLYPIKWLRRRIENCCPNRYLTGVNVFIDTFNDPFKDRSDGTCDYRITPGVE